MMLGMHKDIQEKLTKEIDDVFSQETDSEFTIEFLHKFVFLDMFVKETLRLFPPVPIASRETTEEIELGGYLVPKGASIVISIFAMHRDERFWGKDAHLFKPERFVEGPTNSHAFQPFTAGARICIGKF